MDISGDGRVFGISFVILLLRFQLHDNLVLHRIDKRVRQISFFIRNCADAVVSPAALGILKLISGFASEHDVCCLFWSSAGCQQLAFSGLVSKIGKRFRIDPHHIIKLHFVPVVSSGNNTHVHIGNIGKRSDCHHIFNLLNLLESTVIELWFIFGRAVILNGDLGQVAHLCQRFLHRLGHRQSQ